MPRVRRLNRHLLLLLLALPLLAALPARATPARPAAAAPGVQVAFWVGEEPTPHRDPYYGPRDLSAFTPPVWRLLQQRHVPLYVNLRYGRDFGPGANRTAPADGAALVREANRRGLAVWAWLVVPYRDGYWAWEGNAGVQRAALDAFLSWRRAAGLRFRGVAIDSEPSLQETAELYGAVGSDPSKLPAFLEKTLNPAKQCASVAAYDALIRDAHHAGLPVALAAYPPVLDDLADGMLALQDALDVVTAPPTDWDAWFFMTYRSTYAGLFHTDPTTGMVTSYARSAQSQFGARGQVSLGIPGVAPYDVLPPIVADVRALATMHAGTVPIYSLELLVRHFGVAGLKAVLDAAYQPLTGTDATTGTSPTPQGEAVRATMRGLDAGAAAATVTVTARRDGRPQTPNTYSTCSPLVPLP